jgi:hypothetical protein
MSSLEGWSRWFRTNASAPAPKFRGSCNGTDLSVSLFLATLQRNSFVPILQARLWSYGDGTVIDGSVGAESGVVAAVRVFVVVAVAVWAACLVAGVVAFAGGKLRSGLALMFVPGLPAAIVLWMLIGGGRQASEDGTELAEELATALNAKPVSPSELV